MPTGQLCDRLIKPFLNPEKRRHFRNAAANRRRIVAEGFQPECQLMPDLVGNDLIFRALPNNAYFFCLFALVKGIEISFPSNRISPERLPCGARTVLSCRSSVLLPHPEGPQSTRNSPVGRTA